MAKLPSTFCVFSYNSLNICVNTARFLCLLVLFIIMLDHFLALWKEGVPTRILSPGISWHLENYLMSTTMQSLGLFDRHSRFWANTRQDFLSIPRFLVVQRRPWNPAKNYDESYSNALHKTTFSATNYFFKNLCATCLTGFWIRFSYEQTVYKKKNIDMKLGPYAAQEMNFSLNDFFSKCDQIFKKLHFWCSNRDATLFRQDFRGLCWSRVELEWLASNWELFTGWPIALKLSK